MDREDNQPMDRLYDTGVKASIWENDGENGVYHSTKIAKVYTDKDGKLRDSHSFSSNDLLKVSRIAGRAYDRIAERREDLRQERDQKTERDADAGRNDRAPRNSRSADNRASRRDAYREERSERGGGDERSQVPRRDASFLSDDFLKPSLT